MEQTCIAKRKQRSLFSCCYTSVLWLKLVGTINSSFLTSRSAEFSIILCQFWVFPLGSSPETRSWDKPEAVSVDGTWRVTRNASNLGYTQSLTLTLDLCWFLFQPVVIPTFWLLHTGLFLQESSFGQELGCKRLRACLQRARRNARVCVRELHNRTNFLIFCLGVYTKCITMHNLASQCNQIYVTEQWSNPTSVMQGLVSAASNFCCFWHEKSRQSVRVKKVVSIQRKCKGSVLLLILLLLSENKTPRKYWVHPINQRRESFGEFHKLVGELKEFPDQFFHYFHMTEKQFKTLLGKIEDKITGSGTNFRKSICPEEKLAVCLRFIAFLMAYLIWQFLVCLHWRQVPSAGHETCALLISFSDKRQYKKCYQNIFWHGVSVFAMHHPSGELGYRSETQRNYGQHWFGLWCTANFTEQCMCTSFLQGAWGLYGFLSFMF